MKFWWMGVYVMGDIHGAEIALKQCMERSGFNPDVDTLIQLGDVTDAYPGVYDCVEILLGIRHLVALKGNHDDWFLEFLRTGYHPVGWNHGGKATALSYLKLTGRERLIVRGREGYKTALDPADIPETHHCFFASQQLYHIDDEHNFYVHAGFNRHLTLSSQRPETFYWDRELWAAALEHHTVNHRLGIDETFHNESDFHEIYIGHTPTMNWKTDKPMRAMNILNLDTGAGHSGRLTIMDIHSKSYWQSDPVNTLYKGNARE